MYKLCLSIGSESERVAHTVHDHLGWDDDGRRVGAVAAFLAAQHGWRAPAGTEQLALVFGAVQLALTAVGLLFPFRILKGRDPEALGRLRNILGCALAEAACLPGLVALIVTYDVRLLVTTTAPLLLLLTRMPSESRWEKLTDPGETPMTGGS